MRKVGAREANQRFSELLREVESGKEVTITRNGKPVAQLVPSQTEKERKERKKSVAKLMALLEKGIPLGGPFTRDEMHER